MFLVHTVSAKVKDLQVNRRYFSATLQFLSSNCSHSELSYTNQFIDETQDFPNHHFTVNKIALTKKPTYILTATKLWKRSTCFHTGCCKPFSTIFYRQSLREFLSLTQFLSMTNSIFERIWKYLKFTLKRGRISARGIMGV